MKNILSKFFQIPYSENIFLNKSFVLASRNLCSVQWKEYAFVQRFFFMLETITEIAGNQFQRKKIFLLVETFSLIFLPEEAVFLYRRNLFSNKCLILGSRNGFSGQYKPFFIYFFQRLLPEKAFFLSNGNVFLNESFIPAIAEEFFSQMETVALLESFFLLAATVTAMSGNQF